MPPPSNRNLALSVLALVAGMLMLSYAAVPLYKLFCEITGLEGMTQRALLAPRQASSRMVTVHFNADTDPTLSWKFKPAQNSMKVRVGEQSLAFYDAQNLQDRAVTGNATYNVTPLTAGRYFAKIECFCFREQTLAARQKAHMPVSFFIDPAILEDPDLKDIDTITLSYTFFEVRK